MDLSFPCGQGLDDGVFDLGLDEDEHLKLDREEMRDMSSPAGGITSITVTESKPDALDLAQRAFTASTTKGRNSVTEIDIIRANPQANGPFCDAAIRQHDIREHRSTNGNVIVNAEERSGMGTILPATNFPLSQRGVASSSVYESCPSHDNLCGTYSPRASNERLGESPKAFHGQAPRPLENKGTATTVVVSPQIPGDRSLAGDHITAKRGGESLPRGLPPSQQLSFLRSLAKTDPGGSIHARERFKTLDAIALNAKREKKTLITTVERAFPPYPSAAINSADGAKDERNPLEVDKTGSDDEESPPLTTGDSDKRKWEEKTCAAWGLEDDDLLAKASELHSSVAVQLRKVKELLKRKSYIYIDTTWSARQLPCPPTAWKGKQGVNPPNIVDATADQAEGKSFVGSVYGTTEKQADTQIRANVSVMSEGRWATPVAKKVKVGIYSIPGEKMHKFGWRSQDAGMALAPLDRRKTQALFAVFDGHGVNGREASRECMERLPKYLNSISRFGDPASALRRTCHRLHRDLTSSDVAGDCSRSGTTLCAAILTGRRLTVANVGDSGCLRVLRAHGNLGGGSSSVAGDIRDSGDPAANGLEAAKSVRRAGEKHLVIERLSRDHKPECRGELERIGAAGGVVFPPPGEAGGGKGNGESGKEWAPLGKLMPEPGGNRLRAGGTRDFGTDVARVWKPGCDGPGLAMSRSIGDKLAHSVGVTHEPEIMEVSLDPRCEVMLVLASDGVWDVLGAEDIRKIAESHSVVENDMWCPQAVSEDICKKSRSEWLRVTSGGSDDITCLIIKTSDMLPTKRTPPPARSDTERARPPRRVGICATDQLTAAGAAAVSRRKRVVLRRGTRPDAEE